MRIIRISFFIRNNILNSLRGWNVGKGTHFDCMFKYCYKLTSLEPLSSWDTRNGQDFRWMFYNTSIKDGRALSKWNVGKGQSFKAMFGKNGMNKDMLPKNLKDKNEILSDKNWFE